jgi:hypothetical protein
MEILAITSRLNQGCSMTDPSPEFQTYAAFWPFYLSQHKARLGRQLHIAGTLLGLAALIKAVLSLSLLWLLLALFLGYGFAWAAHHFVEKNHPATFSYPLWSLRGDFHMVGLWLSGRLEAELKHYDIGS